ncbi:hypothetical protein NKG05_17685 [Oerskovia sp. M15]
MTFSVTSPSDDADADADGPGDTRTIDLWTTPTVDQGGLSTVEVPVCR